MARTNAMADKTFTSSLPPSTAFDSRTSRSTLPSIHQSSSINTIISASNRPDKMEHKPQYKIQSSLMSPPEAIPADSFMASSLAPRIKLYEMPKRPLPMSPPISPETKLGHPEDQTSLLVRDPILYPSLDVQNASHPPLFNDHDESSTALRVVEGHVAAREPTQFREASPPKESEYQLALEFKSHMFASYDTNRSRWLKRERQFLQQDRMLGNYRPIVPGTRPVRPPPRKPQGTVKNKPPKKPSQTTARAHQTGEGVKRPTQRREDKDFNSLVDYSPPLSSLPPRIRELNPPKHEGKSSKLDLRGDPHAHLLHPDEMHLASNLRLDCASYLTQKRRVFIGKIESLREGQTFRKTQAQKACNIDVNKASRLWDSFNEAGWFRPEWVDRFI
ncbi:hypothetical protein B7494_g3188 [Chlorociboria aeruginascens]|nr:hypothetical protein B7494_g3188 [Chlorociboria aeruginascens]